MLEVWVAHTNILVDSTIMTNLRIAIVSAISLLLCSCSGLWYVGFLYKMEAYEVTNPEYPAANWPKVEHTHAGLLYEKAEQFEGLRSFLVAKDGKLIAEWYAESFGREDAINIKSASKSVISALVGIAIEKKYFGNINQPLIEIIPEYFPSADETKRFITIRHLLTMSAGLEHIENVNNTVYFDGDWTLGILGLPMMHEPGARFNYGTIQTHLLSAALTKVSGMDTLTFAQIHLFNKLNVSINRWDKAPEGTFFGGSEMYLTPRDMAAFGQLYLDGGHFQGQQLIATEWVGDSVTPSFKNAWSGADYGFSWWIKNHFGYATYYAQGYGGQTIMNIPELDMVFVTTADYPPLFYDHRKREKLVDEFIKYGISKLTDE